MERESLKDIILKSFNIDLPISGGNGSSIEDAIVIELDSGEAGVALEYDIIKYIHALAGKKGKVVKQELLHQAGKSYDKLYVVLKDDPENYHSYYFDITRFYGR